MIGALLWLQPAAAGTTIDESMPPSGLMSLTAAERAVADLVAEGLTNRAIAQRLVLSPYAVHSYLRRVFAKLGVRSRVQMARTFERSAAKARTFAAIDETRRSIERDLQDGLQQRLARLGLSLSLARTSVPPERADLKDELGKAAEGLVEATECLREIYRDVYPAILTDKGLRPAIQTLARRAPIPVEFDLQVDERFPRPVEIGVYHLVREALTHAAKDAKASVVRISVASSDGFLDVTARDDGVGGTNLNDAELTGLTDRVEAMGASMRLVSPPGAGTLIQIKLPAKGDVPPAHEPEPGPTTT
ncbi:MAG TPA: LuxR C-terminal-related transcriptional regulator [Dactylosporangium sp.]|nr:LuxR C-terminal-related transcriptional regulator [Dactylosporangium sp.]